MPRMDGDGTKQMQLILRGSLGQLIHDMTLANDHPATIVVQREVRATVSIAVRLQTQSAVLISSEGECLVQPLGDIFTSPDRFVLGCLIITEARRQTAHINVVVHVQEQRN